MVKKSLLTVILAFIISITIVFSININASKAGIGVLNVPPEYSITRVVQEDNIVKIYLTLSDYNSWEDIYNVSVALENKGTTIAFFKFKQYANLSSFDKIAEFSEEIGKSYLITGQCTYSHSNKIETIADRCLLNLLFVFYSVPCTRLNILTYDRGGLMARTHIDYTVEGVSRSDKTIMPPWMNIPIDLSIYTLDALAIAFAVTVTGVFIRKEKEIKSGGRITI